jgi:hypothetical protein
MVSKILFTFIFDSICCLCPQNDELGAYIFTLQRLSDATSPQFVSRVRVLLGGAVTPLSSSFVIKVDTLQMESIVNINKCLLMDVGDYQIKYWDNTLEFVVIIWKKHEYYISSTTNFSTY